jgi:hypothetical protein
MTSSVCRLVLRVLPLVLVVGCSDDNTTAPDPRSVEPDLAATVSVDRTIRALDIVGAAICSGGSVAMLMSLTATNVFVEPIPGGGFLFRSNQIFKGTGVPPIGTDPETGAPLPAPDGTGYRFFQARSDVQHFEPTGTGEFFVSTTASFTARSLGPGPDLRLHASYRQTFNPLTGEIAFKPGQVSIEGCTGQ